MSEVIISNTIKYIGADDHELDLFESQYHIANGVSYNSYIILDEKIAIMDTVDKRAVHEWMEKVEKALEGRTPDYLVVQHMEPDHSSGIANICRKYPDMKLVATAKAFPMMDQFFAEGLPNERITVGEKDTLELGTHTLNFFTAPMVHWPEVMVTYESTEKILFSADGFGKFGALDVEEEWTKEARRYFLNIVGKYGPSVQALLKKAATLDIAKICPLHGPVLSEDLDFYLEKYDRWSSYQPEEEGIVLAYASIYGNTKAAVEELEELLKQKGESKISVFDLSRSDMAEAVAEAFRFDRLVIAGPTYDGNLFPCVQDFLYHLQMKNYQNRKVGLIENGSWAPLAAKKMQAMLEPLKNITMAEPVVTVRSALNEESRSALESLAEAMVKKA